MIRYLFKRKIDITARFGGEEFIILLVDEQCKNACELAEMLRVLVVAIMGFMYQMQMGCKLLALETLLLSALVGILPEAVQIIMAFIHILLEPASRPVLIAILILQEQVEIHQAQVTTVFMLIWARKFLQQERVQ